MSKKRKIYDLSYNAVFNALISNNRFLISKIIDAAIEYLEININIPKEELILMTNILPISNYNNKQFICDYIASVDNNHKVNIELNRKLYPGLKERNSTYIFQVFYGHFKAGSSYKDFKKFYVFQINFNKFKNKNGERISKYLLLNSKDISNVFTNNIQILDVDIESCYKYVYNNNEKEKISKLERIGALINCNTLESVNNVIGSDILTMEEKEKLLNSINEIASDKNIEEAVKLEDNIEYRFEATREEALEEGIQIGIKEGIEEGIEQNSKSNIINMLKEKIDKNIISKVTGKDINYITKLSKEIQ